MSFGTSTLAQLGTGPSPILPQMHPWHGYSPNSHSLLDLCFFAYSRSSQRGPRVFFDLLTICLTWEIIPLTLFTLLIEETMLVIFQYLLYKSCPDFLTPSGQSFFLSKLSWIWGHIARCHLKDFNLPVLDLLLTDSIVCQTPRLSNNSVPFTSCWNNKHTGIVMGFNLW